MRVAPAFDKNSARGRGTDPYRQALRNKENETPDLHPAIDRLHRMRLNAIRTRSALLDT